MKNAFLLGLALVAATILPASAGSYVTAFGGANWDDVNSEITSDTGGTVGVAFGDSVKAVPGLRAEIEGSFRTNDVSFAYISAKHKTEALMGNLAYDFPIDVLGLHPYALVGVGYAHSEGVIEDGLIGKLEADGVAYQLGAGVTTQIADGVTAGIGYRYFGGPELQVFGESLSDGTNHSVLASLTMSLN